MRVQVVFILQLITSAFGSELSLLTGELDIQFGDLIESQSLLCSQNALDEFVSQCLEKGADNVSPRLRLQLAVKLSVCELKEANVKYPETCHDMKYDNDFQECVREFRETPQLWTTYSGHYRKLRSVCYEESVPFIRRNILDLFFNVTRIYTDFHRSAMKTSEETQFMQEELLKRFQAIVDLMDDSFAFHQKQKDHEERAYKGFEQAMMQRSTKLEHAWDHATLEIAVKSDKVDHDLDRAHAKLQTLFEYIDSQFSNILAANELLAAAHFNATQGISNDLTTLSENSKNGHLVLQELLNGNLHKSSQVNYLLQDAPLQIRNIFSDIEKTSRALIANVTRELKDEALAIYVVFRTTFEDLFSQLRYLSMSIGQTIFNLDAVSLRLDANLETLQERILDVSNISVSSLFTPVVSSAKVALCVIVALFVLLSCATIRQERGAFFTAVLLGAATAFCGKSLIVQLASL